MEKLPPQINQLIHSNVPDLFTQEELDIIAWHPDMYDIMEKLLEIVYVAENDINLENYVEDLKNGIEDASGDLEDIKYAAEALIEDLEDEAGETTETQEVIERIGVILKLVNYAKDTLGLCDY